MIKIKGHSNDEVCVIRKHNTYILVKSSIYDRLNKQIIKQKYIYNNNFLKNCYVPKILSYEYSNNKNIYTMTYLYNSLNLIEFINLENSLKVKWLINNLQNIIESYIQKCTYQYIDLNILKDKIKSTETNIKNNKLINNDLIILK